MVAVVRRLALVLVVAWVAPVVRAQDSAALQAAVDRYADSIVTIKCLLKMNIGGRGGGGDQETETELSGVMIDPAGLVLCSNTQLGGIGAMITRMFGGNLPGFSITSNVTDVRVLVGPEEEEFEAKLLTRDQDLDLAWVEINPSDKKFAAVDLSQAKQPGLGERVVSVRRLGKHFDRVAVVNLATVAGQATKPRKLVVLQETLAGTGLPVFTADGTPFGVVIMQLPEINAGGGAGGFNPMSMLGSMSQLQDVTSVVLPAAQVLEATSKAKADAAKKNNKADSDGEDEAL